MTATTTDTAPRASVATDLAGRVQNAHDAGMPAPVMRRRFNLSRGELEDIIGRDELPAPGEDGY
jgi:hypothetical protein